MSESPLLTVVKEIVQAAGMSREFETAQHFQLTVTHEKYPPLHIESWPADMDAEGKNIRHIRIAYIHTTIMNEQGTPLQVRMGNDQYVQIGGILDVHTVLGYYRMLAKVLRDDGYIQSARKLRVPATVALVLVDDGRGHQDEPVWKAPHTGE